MSRYIDADALKAFIRNKYFQCDMPEEWGNGVMWATSQINRYCNKVAPSIDIVRCQDCRHRYMDADLQVWTCTYGLMIKPDGFCNYGEVRDE